MASISLPTAIIGAGAIGGAASLGGSLLSGSAAKSAAGQQANAAIQAAMLQNQQYQQTRSDLMPYQQFGNQFLGPLSTFYQDTQGQLGDAARLAQANLPGRMTQAELLQTPGYQFQLDQGMKAVQNAQAAKGLGQSGAGVKQAINFASGLASSNYKQQFDVQQQRYLDYVQNLQNLALVNNQVFQQMYGPLQVGLAAAGKTGTLGQQAAQNIGSNIAAAGQAQAAGTAAAGGALGSGLSNLGGTAGNTLTMLALSPYLTNALQGGSPTYVPNSSGAGLPGGGGAGFTLA